MSGSLRRIMPILALTALALASGGAAAASGSTTSAHGTSGASARATRGSSSQAAPSFCCRLYHVAASSAENVWAVGLSGRGSLIVHWNGTKWARYPMSDGHFLYGVSVLSRNDAWAVGGTNWFTPTATLAYRWDGRAWTRVSTPTPDGNAYFTSVVATSARNAWAVGSIGPGGPGVVGYYVPLIEHWNGSRWTQQFFPLPMHSGFFTSVAAAGPGDAWAVGGTRSQRPNSGLIEHWNGYRWRRVNTPPGLGFLQGVTVISRNDAWAVGFSDRGSVDKSLILHWNGRRWYVVPSPNPTGDTNLTGVGASGPGSVWATGYLSPSSCSPQCAAAVFHWNGKQWSYVASPNPGGLDVLLGVVALSSRNAWAVGTANWAQTIIDHWNGRNWS